LEILDGGARLMPDSAIRAREAPMNVQLATVDRGANAEVRIAALMRLRLTTALSLTTVVIAVYFGFMALFAFDKPLLGVILVPGLSLGILLGPLIIVSSFILCLGYVVWANAFFDQSLEAMKR
jgi:uncharacterized membrane protein (DUF485 family)